MKILLVTLILSLCFEISLAQPSQRSEDLRRSLQKVAQDIEKQNRLLQEIPEGSSQYWEAEKQLIFLEIYYDELLETLEKSESSKKNTPKSPATPPQAWLGVSVEKIPESLRKIVGLPENLGLLVQSVQPGSPAEKAGLQKLDILLSCDGAEIQTLSQFGKILHQKKPQDRLRLQIMQKGTTSDIEIVLAQKSSTSTASDSQENGIEDFLQEAFTEEQTPSKVKKTPKEKKPPSSKKKTSSQDLLEEFTQNKNPSTPDSSSGKLFNNFLEGLAENPETQKALLDTAEKGLEQFLGKDQKRLVKNLRKQAESFMDDFEDPEQRQRFLEDTEVFTKRFLGKNGTLTPEVQEALAEFFGPTNSPETGNFNADDFLEQILAENPKELERLLKQLGTSKQTAGFRRFLKRAIANASTRKKEREHLTEEIDELFGDVTDSESKSEESLTPEKTLESTPADKTEKTPETVPLVPLVPSIPSGPKPFLGLKLLPMSPILRSQLDLGENEGVLVNHVEDPGPATTAGFQKGDVLLSIQGNTVSALGDVARLLRGRNPGDSLEMKINRKGEVLTLQLVLGTKSE